MLDITIITTTTTIIIINTRDEPIIFHYYNQLQLMSKILLPSMCQSSNLTNIKYII